MLREKFPEAMPGSISPPPKECLKLGLPAIDELGVPAVGLSEISSSPEGSSGLSLIIASLLESQASPEVPLALVDYRSSCDVQGLGPLCERLLWIRCKTPQEAIQCTDMLLHDGNLPIIMLDLLRLPAREHSRIRPSSWHRLRQLSERHGCSLLVLNDGHRLPSTNFHCQVQAKLNLESLHHPRHQLQAQLRPLKVSQVRTG